MKRSEKYTVAEANKRLTAEKSKAKLKQRGQSLYMVATLPPKPGNRHIKPYQQEISTGQKVCPEGVKYAEARARLLSGQLAANKFRWEDYPVRSLRDRLIVRRAIAAFETYYTETHSLKDSTWRGQWRKVFNRLPQDKPLTADLLRREALSKPRDTRVRLEACRKLQHLADFHKIDIDLLQYKGNYGPSKVRPRDLPSDSEIAYWYEQIPSPRWKWVYGLMACSGVRPHEAFFAEWNGDQLKILQGKTGPRRLEKNDFFFKEWVEAWDLKKVLLPDVDAQKCYEKGEVGQRVSQQFRRYGVPFPSYTLRHCHAVRMALFGVPVSVASRIHGHSAIVHSATYLKHITPALHRQAVARAQEASDRPRPPGITQ